MIKQADLRLFQFCDSQFPTGGFSHSYGLETYIQRNDIDDAKTYKEWLTLFLNEQLTYSDGLAIRMLFEALENNDEDKVLEIDKMLYVQNLPRESRVGAKHMGTRMLKLALELYDSPWCQWYNEKLKNKEVYAHQAVVFALIGHYFGAETKTIIDYYLYQNVANLTQNAVRAIPLGQTAGQKIVSDLIEEIPDIRNHIMSLDKENFGLTAPGLELSQMEHEDLHVRIFIS